MNFQGVFVGMFSLAIIGIFHPVVIKCEYHFSQKIWPLFLLCGLCLLAAGLLTEGFLSDAFSITGVSCFWSIKELKEQARRVEKGWFPRNPKRK